MRIDGDNMTSVGSVAKTRSAVALIADDQVVDTLNKGHIALSSDNGTAGNRTFVLNAGVEGQELLLEWVGTNAAELIDDSANSNTGNVRLAGTWTPTQYDTLSLRFNGTDWLETGRSTN